MDQQQFDRLSHEIGFRKIENASWGVRRGYWLSLQTAAEDLLTLRTAVVGKEKEPQKQLDSWLAVAQYQGKVKEHSDADGSISASLPVVSASSSDIDGFLDALVVKLEELGLRPGCFNCNEAIHAPAALVNGAAFGLCDACYNKLQAVRDAALRERKRAPVSVVRGFLGALVGGLLGSAVWILIGSIGFYAGIAGLAIAWAAFTGYKLLKGPPNRASPFVIGASIILSVLFAEAAGLVLQIMKEAAAQKYHISLIDGIRILPAVLQQGDATSSILLNLSIGLVFAGLGSWRLLRTLYRQTAAPIIEVRRA
ncbi:MAG: hypothetical protein ABSG21_12690 [Spirochaetia bacterium]